MLFSGDSRQKIEFHVHSSLLSRFEPFVVIDQPEQRSDDDDVVAAAAVEDCAKSALVIVS